MNNEISPEMSDQLEETVEMVDVAQFSKILDRGIPAWHATFIHAVNNGDNTPENEFSTKSNNPSKHVQMWWVNGDGLLCLHRGKYFLVPSSNVKFVKLDVNEDMNG